MNYNDLQIKILQFLRIHPTGATGKELARSFGVSLNTIRREFSVLYDILNEDSLELISRPSIGYQLVVLDEEAARTFFQNLNVQSNNPLFDNNKSHNYKMNYIIRKLLTKNDYVPLIKIANELNYSESSVRRDLKLVEKELKHYSLTLKQRKNYGLYIEGSELNKRICLISQHKFFVNLPKEQQKLEPDFWSTFAMGDAKIRDCTIKIRKQLIGHPKLTFKLINFPIVFNYIPIIHSRHKYTKLIHVEAIQKTFLKNGGLIDISRELLLNISDVIDINEEEILAFAMILQAYRSVTDMLQLTNTEREFMRNVTQGLLDEVDQTIYISDIITSSEFDDLTCILYGVMNKIIYSIEPDLEEYRTLNKVSPLIEDLCLACANYLEIYFHGMVSYKICLSFYYLFAIILKRKLTKLLDLKLAVLSTYGMQYGIYCKNTIQEEYFEYVSDVEVLEYSQVTEEKLKGFDYIVSDVRISMLPKTCKPIYCFLESQSYQYRRVKGLEDIIDSSLEEIKSQYMYFYNLESDDLDSIICEIRGLLNAEDSFDSKIKRRLHFGCEQNHAFTLYFSCSSSKIETGAYFFKLLNGLENTKVQQIVCVIYNRFDYKAINVLNKLLSL